MLSTAELIELIMNGKNYIRCAITSDNDAICSTNIEVFRSYMSTKRIVKTA